ncbi:hypothetical protein GOBAR_DD32006 [Gossypium barbadense]|nr:hypothetical protein GOBAR_DD32006 [Gossypium barbadense]
MPTWYDDEEYCNEGLTWANKTVTTHWSFDEDNNVVEFLAKPHGELHGVFSRYNENEGPSWSNGLRQTSVIMTKNAICSSSSTRIGLKIDDNVYRYLYEQHMRNQRSRRVNGTSMNQRNHDQNCGEYNYTSKFPPESDEYKYFYLSLESQAKS